MKQTILFFFLCLSSFLCSSQASITKPTSKASYKSIKDFGAIPGDDKDDTWAFIKAGKYFSNLWNINGVPLQKGEVNFKYSDLSARLDIPAGIYLVGKQVDVPETGLITTYGKVFGSPQANEMIQIEAGRAYKYGFDLLLLKNDRNDIDQFVIKGTGATMPVIQYNDNLVLGFFNNKGKAQFMTVAKYNAKYYVNIGSFLQTENCRNIVFENIEIDGNNIPVTLGGKTVYNGGVEGHAIQLGANGAYFIDTKNVTVTNAYIHHMTLDGVVFQDHYKDPVLFKQQALSNLSIDKLKSNYNRRQGLSWVGGRGVTVSNSTFNQTGTTVDTIGRGSPGAGLDIEPEAIADGSLLWCMDGKFTNCEFVNNTGNALGNDITANRSKNVSFRNCIFHDVNNYAVWVKGKQFSFDNCKIWGGFIHGNAGLTDEDATKFTNCDFADEELAGSPGIYNKGFPLVESWNTTKRMRFDNCTFRTLHPDQRLMSIYSPSRKEEEFNIFSNCSFIIGAKSHADEVMFGCVFDGNTKFTGANVNETERIYLNGIIFTGSNNAQKPYNFSVEGNILLSVANTNGSGLTDFIFGRNKIGTKNTDGYLNFTLGAKSCLYTFWNQRIDIGKNSHFINKAEGQLVMLTGDINNEGKITLEDGSNTAFFATVNINTASTGNPQFNFNKKAKMAMSPYWFKNLPGLGATSMPMEKMKLSSNTKFRGGNTGIPQGRAIQ